MQIAFAHPHTVAADLMENGMPVEDVKFVGIERLGNTGILEIIIELIQSIVV